MFHVRITPISYKKHNTKKRTQLWNNNSVGITVPCFYFTAFMSSVIECETRYCEFCCIIIFSLLAFCTENVIFCVSCFFAALLEMLTCEPVKDVYINFKAG